jgi:hypothetical protein
VTSTGSNDSNSICLRRPDWIWSRSWMTESRFAELLAFVSDFWTFIEGIYWFFSVLVLCTQVNNYDVCDVTLSVYPHRASLKTHRGRAYFPTVAGHIFQARPVWIYTQSNITNIVFIDVYRFNCMNLFNLYKFSGIFKYFRHFKN